MPVIQVDQIVRDDPSRSRLRHDQQYENGVAFVNGTYCPLSEASVPLLDGGFVSCDATYEKVTVAKGKYFRLQDHFDRFNRSCTKFRLSSPYSNQQIQEILDRLLQLSGLKEAGVFWCLTRGLAKPGVNAAADRNKPDAFVGRLYAFADHYLSVATPEQRTRGLDLMVSKTYIRIAPRAVDPTAKNFHWMDMKLSLFEAGDHGKDWSVLTDQHGYVTEAPGANIFILKNGELHTPESGCLEGITRQATLELAEFLNLRVHLRKIHSDELLTADDAFLTSSAGGIMPVNSIDGVILGGVPGPGEIATRVHNLYWEKMWDGWGCTPVNYRE